MRFVEPTPAWMADAYCLGSNPDLFFPTVGGSAEPAKAVCACCPVIVDCLEFALANHEKDGVWGGKSRMERRAIARARRRRAVAS